MDSQSDNFKKKWALNSRCTSAAFKLYPHNSRRAYEWAEMAMEKALKGESTPEILRDKQAPNIQKIWAKRPYKGI